MRQLRQQVNGGEPAFPVECRLFPMNALVLTFVVLAVAVTAAAILLLCYATLTAKDGYEDETGFHAGEPAVAKAAPQKRPMLTPHLELSA